MSLLARRRFLQHALGSAAGLSLGLWGLRSGLAQAQATQIRSVALDDEFHVLTVGRWNVLAVNVGDGIALVDGGPAAESRSLLKSVAALPNAGKVHTLFNTHWHPEQTGSNDALGRAGARIISQENTVTKGTMPSTVSSTSPTT